MFFTQNRHVIWRFWLAVFLEETTVSCSFGLCDNHQQIARSNIRTGRNSSTSTRFQSWTALRCIFKSNFERRNTGWLDWGFKTRLPQQRCSRPIGQGACLHTKHSLPRGYAVSIFINSPPKWYDFNFNHIFSYLIIMFDILPVFMLNITITVALSCWFNEELTSASV